MNKLRCSLPKSSRLRRTQDFTRVYKQHQMRVSGKCFIILAFCRDKPVAKSNASGRISASCSSLPRMGVVVSKKVSKLAVRRNRIKRFIREHYRQHSHPQAFDFVVIAKPLADVASVASLTTEWGLLWEKIHRRCST